MPFPLVHFEVHLVLNSTKGVDYDIWSREIPPYNAAIDFDYQYAKSGSPSSTPITIHGLTNQHASLFTKGSLVTIYAGWANADFSQNNVRKIISEKIADDENTINESGDIQTSFNIGDASATGKKGSSRKKRSKDVRLNASDLSHLSLGERRALLALKKKYGIKTNNIKKLKDDIRKIRDSLGPKEKAEKAALMTKYADRHGGGRKSGDGAYNKAQTAIRKRYRDQITKKYQNRRKQLSEADQALMQRGHALVKARTKRARHIRSTYRAKRKRVHDKRTKNKAKSIKHKNGMHFKKGTMASTIIWFLAHKAHIKIFKMDLVKNKRYTSGFTVDKSPRQTISEVVQDCKSSIWYEHGKMVIGNFANHVPDNFTLTTQTGLINPVQKNDDDDDGDDSNSVSEYTVNCIFLPQATTGYTFRIIDPDQDLIDDVDHKEPISRGEYFNDVVVVISGDSSVNSGDTPTSNMTVIKASEYMAFKNGGSSSGSKKKTSKKTRIKNRKDARSRKRTRAKRAARQHARTGRQR